MKKFHEARKRLWRTVTGMTKDGGEQDVTTGPAFVAPDLNIPSVEPTPVKKSTKKAPTRPISDLSEL